MVFIPTLEHGNGNKRMYFEIIGTEFSVCNLHRRQRSRVRPLEACMQQIEITGEALPIVKSGIVLKEKLLSVKAANYQKRLKRFERKHKMKSAAFSKAFAAGKLGDAPDWFDWLFVYEAYNKINKQKEIINGLSL